MAFVVTDKAAQILKEIQSEQEEAPGKTLRLVQREEEFGLAFDAHQEDDQVLRSEDSDVLLVAPDVAMVLADAIMDVQETSEGPRLTLSRQPE